jgi:hypothetical protein
VSRHSAAAVFESVFRDLPPKPNPRIIRQGSLIGVGHASLATRRALKLAAFFKQELALLGESRESMIECDASAYAKTVLWAAAIHASPEAFDGIAWASRQYDGAHAYVLFGTRVRAMRENG